MYVEAGRDGITTKCHVTETEAFRPVHDPPDYKGERKANTNTPKARGPNILNLRERKVRVTKNTSIITNTGW